MEDVIKLIQENITVDEYGNETVTASAPKDVFALIASVGRNEFYAAAHAGLKPEITFQIRVADYGREELVEYDGMTYQVIRTYQTGTDWIELVCERKVVNYGNRS